MTKPAGLAEVRETGPELGKARRGARKVWLKVAGRSIQVRGLRAQPSGPMKWLVILGPGLIAASAGNDAGGITTYTSAGAAYGYKLIWVMLALTLPLGLFQEMCARIGAATGRGLVDLIRERFGLGWALLAVSVFVVANVGLVVSEFVGIGSAARLFGISPFLAVPLSAAALWYVVVLGSYNKSEKIFLLMTVVFLAYPLAVVLAKPDWSAVASGAFIPRLERDPEFLFLLVALIGTTITPFMQLFQQSSTVEKGVTRRNYGPERADAYFGAFFSNLMSIAMIVAAGATLHAAGKKELENAAQAADALAPVVGSASHAIFGVGLLGACLLAAAVLPLATAYAVSEAFGLPKGVALDRRRGKIFYGLFTGLLLLGAGLALIPGLPVVKLLTWVQVLNGILLPVILTFILILASDRRLMGALRNGWKSAVLGWTCLAVITIAVGLFLLDMTVGIF